MGDTNSFIKRHIARKADGELFSTRELLGYGKRSTVDQVTSRLVEAEYVVRVARGVFVKSASFCAALTPIPSVDEIVRCKTAAFKKTIVTSAKAIARQWGFKDDDVVEEEARRKREASGKRPLIGPVFDFAVSGCSSSFLTVHGTVVLTQVADRKIALGDSVAGKTLRTMWHVGRWALLTNNLMREKLAVFRREDREEMRTRTDILPQWLTKILGLEVWLCKPQRKSDVKAPRRTSEYDPALRNRTQPRSSNVPSDIDIFAQELGVVETESASLAEEVEGESVPVQPLEEDARDGPESTR